VCLCSAMAFAGPGPEVINGRLAMLAFVAAAGAELATGFTVMQQLREAPALVGVTFVIFVVASLVRLTFTAFRNTCTFAVQYGILAAEFD
jgi:drug/metabolite transporter superfamily protein YnfA